MKINRLIGNTVLAVICLLLVIPTLIYGFPFLVDADSSYIVLSGSMSPALCLGDLVLVKATDPSSVNVGDMVTVKSEAGVFTHRVFEKKLDNGVTLFRTKGDANEDPDTAYFDASQLVGRVVLVVPFRHLYTPYGFLSLVLAPTALIIGKQMHRIYDATKRRNRKELIRWRRKNRRVLETSTMLLALILVASTTRIMAPFIWVGSRSYFCDVEHAWGVFSAGRWVPSFYAEGWGWMHTSACVCGRATLVSDGETVTLTINGTSSSWAVLEYHEGERTLDEEILRRIEAALEKLGDDCDLSILEKIKEISWFEQVYNCGNLKVRIYEHEYVLAYELNDHALNAFFLGRVPDE